jgi:seryl-tRNA synthetase
MLEIHYIQKYPGEVIQGLEKRQLKNASLMVEQILARDQQRRETQLALDTASAQLNQFTKQFNQLLNQDKQEQIELIKLSTKELKTKIKDLGNQLKAHEELLQAALYELPNLPHDEVPIGKKDAGDEVVYQVKELPQIAGNKLPHWELAVQYDIIDFEMGNKVTGAGFPVYKGKGAQLQRALINFCLDEARKAGYTEIQPPILINKASGYGTGQLPDKEGQMYQLLDDQLYLIPTAEVPVTNLYRQQILSSDDLPIRNVAYTPCFRREAGSWGSHVRGLNRLHQFDKVEIVEIRYPAESYQALVRMRNYVEYLLDKLELPYRVVKLCSGSLGFAAAMTYDIEVFAGAQERWLEVSSISNFETYQANRMQLRYRDQDKIRLLHTLNGSALPLPRIVAALLENNQTEEGIFIPVPLQAYTGFQYID